MKFCSLVTNTLMIAKGNSLVIYSDCHCSTIRVYFEIVRYFSWLKNELAVNFNLSHTLLHNFSRCLSTAKYIEIMSTIIRNLNCLRNYILICTEHKPNRGKQFMCNTYQCMQ